MAINTITWADKSNINTSSVPENNKITSSNMNQIKTVVNANANLQGDLANLTTTEKSSLVGAINEIKTGMVFSTSEYDTGKKWIDGSEIYGKVITTSGINGSNIEISHNISNIGHAIDYRMIALDTEGNHWSYFSGNELFDLIPDKVTQTKLVCTISNAFDMNWPVYHIVEYTKTS